MVISVIKPYGSVGQIYTFWSRAGLFQRSLVGGWDDVDKLTLFENAREGAHHARGEFHRAFDCRVERIIFALFDVPSNMDPRPALAHEDFSRTNRLTVATLHAQALCVGIVNVLGGPTRFLMCHRSLL